MWSKTWRPDADDIGYKKPPKDSQFKPGHSGNPKGRPKNRERGAQLLRKALDAICMVTEKGVPKKISLEELIFKVLVANAVKGQARATALLLGLMQDHGMLKGLDFATNEMIIKLVSADSGKRTK